MRISDLSSDVCSSDLIKAARDEAKAQAALDALRDGAKGKGNLLALAVDCARERCTLGEISLAMEDAFGRHGVDVYPVKGIYGGAYKGDERWTDRKSTRLNSSH